MSVNKDQEVDNSEVGTTSQMSTRFHKLLEAISALMFATLFLTFVAQVFWRYVLRDPLVWTLDVAGILFVTISLFTAATQMRMRDHVGLDLVMDLLPKRLSQWLYAISLTLFAIVMLLSIPDTVRVLEWMFRERTFAIKFNLGYLFVLMIFFIAAYAKIALFEAISLIRNGTKESELDV